MICKAWVKKTQARKRGSREPYTKHTFVVLGRFDPVETASRVPSVIPSELSRCGGKIHADIEAENEPDWGGTYAVLAVAFRCELCGCVDHEPELPNKYQLNDWLTKIIESLP